MSEAILVGLLGKELTEQAYSLDPWIRKAVACQEYEVFGSSAMDYFDGKLLVHSSISPIPRVHSIGFPSMAHQVTDGSEPYSLLLSRGWRHSVNLC
jgi:hypothetical protein